MHQKRSSHSHPILRHCNKTRTHLNRPCSRTSTRSICQLTRSSRRLAICCSRALKITILNSTTSSTTSDHWVVSRPRLRHGSRSVRQRMPQGLRRNSHLFQKTSGRGCSSCRRSPADWKRCSTQGRWSSTHDRLTGSRRVSAPRCSL